jgi:hypothetical protein
MALNGGQHIGGLNFTLVNTTITTAVSGGATTPITGLAGCKYIGLVGVFIYGSGGTTVKVWLQTSMDFGVTWMDILNFPYTTSSLTKVGAVSFSAGATPVTPTDGSLADSGVNQGILGDRFRIKFTSTGTYAGGTTLKVTGNAKG